MRAPCLLNKLYSYSNLLLFATTATEKISYFSISLVANKKIDKIEMAFIGNFFVIF